MKTKVLGHKDMNRAMEELKSYPGATLGYAKGSIIIEGIVKKKVEKKVEAKKDLVDILDSDENGHITQKEVVDHFVKTKSVKETVKILDEIDADNNGRITKKEVKDFVNKYEK